MLGLGCHRLSQTLSQFGSCCCSSPASSPSTGCKTVIPHRRQICHDLWSCGQHIWSETHMQRPVLLQMAIVSHSVVHMAGQAVLRLLRQPYHTVSHLTSGCLMAGDTRCKVVVDAAGFVGPLAPDLWLDRYAAVGPAADCMILTSGIISTYRQTCYQSQTELQLRPFRGNPLLPCHTPGNLNTANLARSSMHSPCRVS